MVARNTDAQMAQPLYVGALGPAGSPGSGYRQMMQHNLNTLLQGLKRNVQEDPLDQLFE
jgi:ABC-type Zn uptake system ZnuABC Zn-binding protein ZnuA